MPPKLKLLHYFTPKKYLYTDNNILRLYKITNMYPACNDIPVSFFISISVNFTSQENKCLFSNILIASVFIDVTFLSHKDELSVNMEIYLKWK